ncbi:hypothetical protein [Bradyrhizobium sp. JYMT SZCCT0180]|uniref:hypothetical protein n=1 Tax=Bradyrhizobium sp. JYMT SZCCT0180 TaxID=2807666 RepID=UPI001BACDF21|nr:hypothetical protein [Bradyrhizobium sp. JYMT SZCCT0180]MBR1216304.1 hypothetical protein [Bradyrhizobium sp. JYMT SZCCT0180]
MVVKKGFDRSWKAWGHWNNIKELLSLIGFWPLLPGGSGGAAMLIFTADYGWSAPAVLLATLAAAAFCAVIFAAIRIAIVYPRASSVQQIEQDEVSVSLRDQNAAALAAMGSELATAMDGAVHRMIHGSSSTKPRTYIDYEKGQKLPAIDEFRDFLEGPMQEIIDDGPRLSSNWWNAIKDPNGLHQRTMKTGYPRVQPLQMTTPPSGRRARTEVCWRQNLQSKRSRRRLGERQPKT